MAAGTNGELGAAGPAMATVGVAGSAASFEGAGTCAGDFTGVLAAPVAGFAASLLRNSPRATLSVPFACSTLTGLVRTRLAPIRKALATPV